MTTAGRVLVTGGSRGIGRVIAEHLANAGRPVTICARTAEDVQAAVNGLTPGDHRCLVLDVSNASGWEGATEHLRDVTGVVCAAGVIGPIGDISEIDTQRFTDTMRVNVTGTLLAMQATASRLRSVDGAAVVLSGGGATGPFARFDAYAASKAAVVRLAENLSESGLRINAIAPGFIVTDMQSDVLEAGPELVGSAYFEKVSAAISEGGGDDPARAAALAGFLLSDAAAGISGKLLSAPWDPWEDTGFQERLRNEKDLATLRRIDDQFFTSK